MRLIFDARHMAQQFTGLGRYTGSLLCALLDRYRESRAEVDVLLHAGVDWSRNAHHGVVARRAAEGRCAIHYVEAPPFSLRHHWSVAAWVNRRGADSYFYPHFDLPIGVRVPSTFVVHDLLPLVVPGYVRRFVKLKQGYFRFMLRRGVRVCTRCVAVSESTRRDILALVGSQSADKVEVAYEGPVMEVAASMQLPDAVQSMVGGRYLLYVGDRRPHKNLRRLIDLFRELRSAHGYDGRLVMAGSTRNFGFDVDAYARDVGGVVSLGNVSDGELASLYRNAEAVMLISEYEGFGLPVVEAARFGRKVVVSDGGSLPEIVPPWGCVVSRSVSVEVAAGVVARYLDSPIRIAANAYLERFSWRAAAEAIFLLEWRN